MVKRKNKVSENGGVPVTYDNPRSEAEEKVVSGELYHETAFSVPSGNCIGASGDNLKSSVVVGSQDVTVPPPTSDADDPAKKGTIATMGPTLRSSSRVLKRSRLDSSPTAVKVSPPRTGASKKGDSISLASKTGVTPEPGKTRRSWELWSKEDTKSFFEALYEFGKDFESIQNFIVQKNRKKNHPPQLLKNKDQVRHFYYRTWHKIAKHLNISDDVKKHVQELYGLINYGELRKKFFGRLDAKNGQKLNELVHTGSTIIRCKGKNLRIKTPVCRALKKLNSIKDPREEEIPKLPPRVTLELRPKTNGSWSRVQGMAQNPRVRMLVGLQRRLLTVLEYLQERWRTPESRQRDALLKSLSTSESELLGADVACPAPEQILRLTPRKTDNLYPVSVTAIAEGQCGASVSLQRYRHKVQCLGDFVVNAGAAGTNSTKKGSNAGSGKGRGAKGAVPDEPKNVVAGDAAVQDRPWSGIELGRPIEDGVVQTAGIPEQGVAPLSSFPEESNSLPLHEVTLRQLLALETPLDAVVDTEKVFFKKARRLVLNDVTPTPVPVEERFPDELDCGKKVSEGDPPLDSPAKGTADVTATPAVDVQQQLERIRRGWTREDCHTVTIGEIYLMLGSPSKIVLEYEWVSSPPLTVVEDLLYTTVLSRETSTALLAKEKAVKRMTTILRQLLGVATTSLTDLGKAKQERQESHPQLCRCTHHCCPTGGSSKTTQSKAGGGGQHKSPPGPRGQAKASKVAATRCVQPSAATVSPSEGNGAFPPMLDATDGFRRVSLVPGARTPTPTADGQSEQMTAEKAFKEQLDKLIPQHRKTKARVKKPVTVQRELPLLPKRAPPPSMMTLRLVPNGQQLTNSYVPILTNATTSNGLTRMVRIGPPNMQSTTAVATLINSSLGTFKMPGPVSASGTVTLTAVASAAALTPTSGSSTTSVASSSIIPPPSATFIIGSAGLPVSSAPSAAVITSPTVNVVAGISSSLLSASTSGSVVPNAIGVPSAEIQPSIMKNIKFTDLRLPGSTRDLVDSSSPQGIPRNPLTIAPSGDRLLQVPPASTIAAIALMEAGVSGSGRLSISPPPNISSLLDMSLTLPDGVSSGADNGNLGDMSADKLLDITNSDSVFGGLIGLSADELKASDDRQQSMPLTMATLTGDVGRLDHGPSSSVNTSPTCSLFKLSSPTLEGHWLNGEVSDFSLSNFLSHLESPAKPMSAATGSAEGVGGTFTEHNFQCLIGESSIDYVAKFEDFAAAQMSGSGIGIGPKNSS